VSFAKQFLKYVESDNEKELCDLLKKREKFLTQEVLVLALRVLPDKAVEARSEIGKKLLWLREGLMDAVVQGLEPDRDSISGFPVRLLRQWWAGDKKDTAPPAVDWQAILNHASISAFTPEQIVLHVYLDATPTDNREVRDRAVAALNFWELNKEQQVKIPQVLFDVGYYKFYPKLTLRPDFLARALKDATPEYTKLLLDYIVTSESKVVKPTDPKEVVNLAQYFWANKAKMNSAHGKWLEEKLLGWFKEWIPPMGSYYYQKGMKEIDLVRLTWKAASAKQPGREYSSEAPEKKMYRNIQGIREQEGNTTFGVLKDEAINQILALIIDFVKHYPGSQLTIELKNTFGDLFTQPASGASEDLAKPVAAAAFFQPAPTTPAKAPPETGLEDIMTPKK
jgi:hypothetical protein